MNKHQVKGVAKEVAGKARKNLGKATANGTQTIKGAARELAGKAEKEYGNVLEESKDDAKREPRDRDIERHTH